MVRIRVAAAVLGVTALLVTLSACDRVSGGADSLPTGSPSAAESAAPSGEPTPSPTVVPAARAASIIVDKDSVSVKDTDGGIIIDIPFSTDPATGVDEMNAAIGLAGTVSTLPGSAGCFHDRQQATWGGLNFVWGDDWQRAPGATFIAVARGADAASGVKITLPSGHSVGASATVVLAANSTAHFDDYGAWTTLNYDVASGTFGGDPDTYYGASALFQGGLLTSIASPIHYYYDC